MKKLLCWLLVFAMMLTAAGCKKNEAPETVIQVNTLKITAVELQNRLEEGGVSARPHSWMEDCLVLGGTGNLEQLPAFREGLFYVQDPASKLSVLCAKLTKGETKVLDCCSAPGGKSFAAAIAMGSQGSITSCDVHAHKTGLIQNGADRLGLPISPQSSRMPRFSFRSGKMPWMRFSVMPPVPALASSAKSRTSATRT